MCKGSKTSVFQLHSQKKPFSSFGSVHSMQTQLPWHFLHISFCTPPIPVSPLKLLLLKKDQLLVCVYMPVCVRGYTLHSHVCQHTCPWRPEVNVQSPLQLLSTLSFETKSLTETGDSQFTQTGCPVSPRDLPISASSSLGLWVSSAPGSFLFIFHF